MRGADIASTARARDLRAASPAAERRLWSRLRDRRLGGFKFVRQAPIGPFFVDFLCRERELVIEVDGATHSTDAEIARDAARGAFLRAQGLRVLRFPNAAVYDNLDGVAETIHAALDGRDHL